jgi:hypothetical protein
MPVIETSPDGGLEQVQAYHHRKHSYQQQRLPEDRGEALKLKKPADQILREDRNPTGVNHDAKSPQSQRLSIARST